eukprot:11699830-Karenia_brevis.AAC.1
MGVVGLSRMCRFLIVEDPPGVETPRLVPISLLKTWGAVLGPKHTLMTVRNTGVVAQLSDVEPSQHQTVNMVCFGEEGWE